MLSILLLLLFWHLHQQNKETDYLEQNPQPLFNFCSISFSLLFIFSTHYLSLIIKDLIQYLRILKIKKSLHPRSQRFLLPLQLLHNIYEFKCSLHDLDIREWKQRGSKLLQSFATIINFFLSLSLFSLSISSSSLTFS